MKKFFPILPILLIVYPLWAEKAYIFTEEGEIIEGEVVTPEQMGISPETLEIIFVEEGEIIMEKIVVEEEFIEEGSSVVLLEEEGKKFISAYESPWEGEEEEIPEEEESFSEEEFEY
jgi:hypothetical protein